MLEAGQGATYVCNNTGSHKTDDGRIYYATEYQDWWVGNQDGIDHGKVITLKKNGWYYCWGVTAIEVKNKTAGVQKIS